ncbi:hypothetical protein A0U91_16985 (plasmid) [Acetobacter persici]|uniref:Uncharacterized protein n=1 Tax=Acetobacter persici TaxID=1076596 RepID=A0A1U9LJW3_9PROT|nr:hypothetical protein A0U91_16985 [Acetobacter persici]
MWGSIGITATNILASDIELLSHVSSASRTDSVYENMALSIIQREAAFQLLTSRPLGSLSESTILSFTAQKKMAEYFTNNIGFVVSVDPAAYGFSIVSSPAAEPFLEEKNPVSLKNEAVTILKLPDEFVVPESNIFDCDFDYLAATNDSRAINLLSSSYRGITYNIAGKEVTKTMSFSNKGRGKLLALYSADGKDPMTGREFLGEFGFSPVPTPKTIQDTSIVSIFKRQSHSTKTEHCERIPEDLIDRLKTLTKKVLIERGVIPECVLSEHDQSLNIQCSVNEELSVNP